LKLYENSPFSGQKGAITIGDRLKGIWRFGLSWDRDFKAQQVFVNHLNNTLDNKFILLRNVILPGLPMPVPLILIGPPGVKAIYASAVKGVFRAKGDKWLALDAHHKRYVAVQPNLVKRAFLISQAVRDYLYQRDIMLPGVEAVNFFSDPGLHIEPVQPTTRIVQRDGIESFVTGILQSPVIMSSTDGQVIAEMLLNSSSLKPQATTSSESPKSTTKARSTGQTGLKSWQWFVLGILLLITLAVLVGFAYIFLTTG
jgi:hypothetical protein